MDTLIWILISTFLVSIISFVGILVLTLKETLLEKLLVVLVALSAGALMGGAFLHLIPEAMNKPLREIGGWLGLLTYSSNHPVSLRNSVPAGVLQYRTTRIPSSCHILGKQVPMQT